MAVYYADIAYGKASYEANVFNDILKMWKKSYTSRKSESGVHKDGNKPADYYENHMATRLCILSLT